MAAQGSAKKPKLITSGTATLLTQEHQRRRKGSGKSIWNLAMAQNNTKSSPVVSHKSSTSNDNNLHGMVCTSCESKDVHSFGNITSRNGDVRKGEIWGTSRDANIVTKYQCNQCGRTWNEEE
jgi:DNA-directed RNA polymerase subunit RPC12/RpoP